MLLAAGIGAAGWWFAHRAPARETWQGYADADFVKVAPTQQGLLTSVAVHRGDEVAAGALLFTQDDADDRAARDQAARQLAQAEEQLANLEAGGKTTEIRQAEANLADAQTTLERSKDDLVRGAAQVRVGGISKQDFEHLRMDNLSAGAKLRAAEAALEQARAPMGREREIAAQRDAVGAAKAALAMAQWRLDQRRVVAPAAGRIADVLARPGETMAAGMPVISLLPPENILVRFFVPETALGKIHPGEEVALACDGCPSGLVATISFIAPQAEYTPPVIYSESSKSKLVFLIEARPKPTQAKFLNPGEPVEVSLDGEGMPR